MSESTIWWLLAGAAVAIELATGTFYLLMLAVGLAAAAIAAHLGAPLTIQIITAAVVGGGAVVGWHLKSGGRPKGQPAQSNPDVHIDIGEPVQIDRWNHDGTATVKYRGASWTAVLDSPGMEPGAMGQFHIKELLGNRLVIEKR
ncbi:MAG: NfeD family protein [Pseudomonadota bacterium]